MTSCSSLLYLSLYNTRNAAIKWTCMGEFKALQMPSKEPMCVI